MASSQTQLEEVNGYISSCENSRFGFVFHMYASAQVIMVLRAYVYHEISNKCGILTCVDSGEPVQPPFKLSNSKCCSVSSLTFIEYSSD